MIEGTPAPAAAQKQAFADFPVENLSQSQLLPSSDSRLVSSRPFESEQNVPTVAKPQFSEKSISELLEICVIKDKKAVLCALGFYREHDPSDEDFHIESENTIKKIEGCLLRCLMAGLEPRRAVIESTLRAIMRKPEKYINAPTGILELLAQNYRRSDEPPGTNWQDLYGEAPINHPGSVQEPDHDRIRDAASAALATLGKAPRPHSEATDLLAGALGAIFLRYNSKFGRISEKDGTTYPERGPFADFLDLVLSGLNEAFPGREINRDSLVRLASDALNARKRPPKIAATAPSE